MSNQILKSASIVLAFWGFLFSVYYGDGYFDTKLIGLELGMGLIFFVLSVFFSNGFREAIFNRLAPTEACGLVSAMGPVPIHRKPLETSTNLDVRGYQRSIPPELDGLDPFATYAATFGSEFPHYVALYEAILRLLLSPQFVGMPATYTFDPAKHEGHTINPNAHGGRTLLEHSILVSGLALMTGGHFAKKYAPESTSKSNDPGFKPMDYDPLAPLLCIAHDLGKLKTFRLDNTENGLVATKIAPNHDLAGARVVADISEFWNPAIPFDERAMIQNILAVYHHPHALPVTPVGQDTDGKYKYRSDRERALLAHLIQCDRTAGQIENGVKVNLYPEEVQASSIDAANEPIADFKTIFFEFLISHGLSNSHGKSIGFKAAYQDKSLVVFDQSVFLAALSDHLGKPYIKEPRPKHLVDPVIGNILQFLDQLGVVYRALGEENRTPETCLYETEVMDREGKCFLTINYGFVLDVTNAPDLAFLQKQPDSAGGFNFLKCKFGAQGTKRQVRVSTEFDIVREELLGETSVREGSSVFELVKQNPPKTKAPTKTKSVANADTVYGIKIPYAINRGKLLISKEWVEEGKRYVAFAGQDEWFTKNGFPPGQISEDDRIKLKIRNIKPSETNPGQHVIVLHLE